MTCNHVEGQGEGPGGKTSQGILYNASLFQSHLHSFLHFDGKRLENDILFYCLLLENLLHNS